MNKRQKEKSREIRDIMRTDRWRKMTYKEAKRKWRKGVRAFPVGTSHMYESFDLGRLGLSRSKMRELGQAYAKIVEYSVMHGLDFECEYSTTLDQYTLHFKGKNYITGKCYRFGARIGTTEITQVACSLDSLADYILRQLDHEVEINGIGPKPEYRYIPVYDSMVLQPMCYMYGRP